MVVFLIMPTLNPAFHKEQFSSLLFLLHINELPSCVNSKVRLFADDCLLYREIKNNQDQIDMQRDLDALMDWGSTWGMKFNATKCNIMRVSRSRKPLCSISTV